MKKTTLGVLRKLGRMKLRTLSISFVISLAMAMIITGLYAGEVFDYSVERSFEDSKMPDVFYEFTQPVNQTLVENALTSSTDVAEYDVRLRVQGAFDNDGDDIAVIIYGIKDPNQQKINILNLVNGSMYSSPSEAVAISGMELVGIDIDEDVEITSSQGNVSLTITGTVSSAEYMFPSAYAEYSLPIGSNLIIIFMDLGRLQNITGSDVNEAVILLSSGGSESGATSALASFEIQRITLQDDHQAKTFMEMGSAKMRNMFPLIGGVFLVVGFISIFMTIYRIVQNDSRHIGVLMSLGYTRGEITRSYMALGLILKTSLI